MRLIPIILCGGAGTRLWPLSRELHPKIFIQLDDGESLLQKAFKRAISLPYVDNAIVVTNKEFFFKVTQELAQVNNKGVDVSYILEPFARNTAAAIAAAILHLIKGYDANSFLMVLPADHLTQDQPALNQAVALALELATTHELVTFGIKPTSPNTGYGYIEAELNTVRCFIEKPSLSMAEQYLASGNFLWNSGMFLARAQTMLDAMSQYCPKILEAVRRCVQKSKPISFEHHAGTELHEESFEHVPNESIDYALLEKAQKVAVVPCELGWSDVGSWGTLEELLEAGFDGNKTEGEVVLHEVSNCYVKSTSRLVGVVGVDNLLIVDTPDALLVSDKNRSHEVKHLYAQLKKQDHESYRSHRTVHRPWGSFTTLEHSERYKIKRIEVKPGASLSLQMHHHRSEHWVVVSGMAKVTNGDQEFFVRTNESTYIPSGRKHRLENPGVVPLIIIEVQSGDYLGEDDIIRYQDNYGRESTPTQEKHNLSSQALDLSVESF